MYISDYNDPDYVKLIQTVNFKRIGWINQFLQFLFLCYRNQRLRILIPWNTYIYTYIVQIYDKSRKICAKRESYFTVRGIADPTRLHDASNRRAKFNYSRPPGYLHNNREDPIKSVNRCPRLWSRSSRERVYDSAKRFERERERGGYGLILDHDESRSDRRPAVGRSKRGKPPN